MPGLRPAGVQAGDDGQIRSEKVAPEQQILYRPRRFPDPWLMRRRTHGVEPSKNWRSTSRQGCLPATLSLLFVSCL